MIFFIFSFLFEFSLVIEIINIVFGDSRWDLNALDSLPYYMQICFHAVYNFVNEISFESLKKNEKYITTPYLKKAVSNYNIICFIIIHRNSLYIAHCNVKTTNSRNIFFEKIYKFQYRTSILNFLTCAKLRTIEKLYF
jgi:hypothetical protein